MRRVVYLSEGDIQAIVVDSSIGTLEVYDTLYSEDNLEVSTGDGVLIQADLQPEEQLLLAQALLENSPIGER